MRSNMEAQIVLGDDELLGAVSAMRRGGRTCGRARRSPARELLGGTELLGRSFIERMASKAAGGVRSVSHVALNAGAKIPAFSSAVGVFRAATSGNSASQAPDPGSDKDTPPLWQNPMVLAGVGLVVLLLLKGRSSPAPVYYAPAPQPAR